MIPPRKTHHPIDAHVGRRLRIRRKLLSMSQTKLGDSVGLTFQQIQKYERGANRIGASRLFEFSEILDVPVSYFFDDMPEEIAQRANGPGSDISGSNAAILDPLSEADAVAVIRAYERVNKSSVRKALFNLAKALSGKND